MREINQIIVHCSATKPNQDIDADTIRGWHLDRGWQDIGYHWVIRRNGLIQRGRPEESIGAHAGGHNSDSIGVCLVGGIDDNGKADANFSQAQYGALKILLDALLARFDASVCGHRDLPRVAKDCPCFDVKAFYGEYDG